ncbi:methionyl-tRNA formyltransferase [Algimonas porphyrae]|uniref:Methionyl-tRNA formyltransferase n=1 Tax=Algimonas porphyrae TaxID=1128113 RepID=A0ABQ5V5F2_9PROT|nr:methionyl-tRNA formyltransferase [Algimonas porphyrae]GLQ21816.1 methionyl-tRNA formyltransferase [Algimonas porphyrae]
MPLNVVFMGTPEFAVPSLAEIVANGHHVVRVYTQPPRKAGRGQSLTKSPVHQFAEIMGLPVETPESFRKPSVIDGLEALKADIACVVAYGQILPQRALDAPTHGCLNLHASLLPRWRGAAPVQRAIMAGDSQTAAQIMQMEKGLDTGAILLSETVPIRPIDTAATLFDRLAQTGAQMWPRVLGAVERGALSPTPQQGEPTYAHKIDKAEARIDWTRSAHELDCLIRGLSPFPGAWCEMGGKRVKVHLAKPENGTGQPGEVLDDDLLIACGTGALRLLQVQPAGKGKMNADAFRQGTPVAKGETLP